MCIPMGDLRYRGRDQQSRTRKDRCGKDGPEGAKGTSVLGGVVYSLKDVNSAVFKKKNRCHRRQVQQCTSVIPDAEEVKKGD